MTNKQRKDSISNNFEFMKDIINKIKNAYESRCIPFKELDLMDYGDIFEMFFLGNKSSIFSLANSLFFLKEESWDLSPDKFINNYIDSINKKAIIIHRYKKNKFITSVLDYFNFKNDKYFNEFTIKDSQKANAEENDTDEYYNEYTYKITFSHCNFTK